MWSEAAGRGRLMKRTRFTGEQIVAILKQSEAGLKTAEICRQNGISEATFYNWKAKYGGMGVSDVQKSDTPRGAGGLMSWTASKAVGHWFRRRAQARLCQQFRRTRLLHPRCLVRGCIGGLAPTQTQPWTRHSREPRNARR